MGYPILPEMRRRNSDPGAEDHNREILTIRHYSLYTPRDFDISPYFDVVKPTVEHGFTYRGIPQREAQLRSLHPVPAKSAAQPAPVAAPVRTPAAA